VTVTRARPFLKWAGGKLQLLGELEPLLPDSIDRYVEPFLGGGAVFFHLSPVVSTALLNDVNPRLVELFTLVRDDVEGLIDEIGRLAGRGANTSRTYYRRRNEYNACLDDGEPLRRCALFVYLNRTCYNGLYRVNGKGLFNVPFGRYGKPRILDEDRLRNASRALARAERIESMDFSTFLLESCREGDFVYLDPPYVPVSTTSSFTSYAQGSFDVDDQRRLADTLAALHARSVRWMLSNSFTPVSRRIFVTGLMDRIGLPKRRPYVRRIEARRAINSRVDRRGPVHEYVLRNYRD
jgi:DNA adenine methylase